MSKARTKRGPIHVQDFEEVPWGYVTPEMAEEVGDDPGVCDHPDLGELVETLETDTADAGYATGPRLMSGVPFSVVYVEKRLYRCPYCRTEWTIWEGVE